MSCFCLKSAEDLWGNPSVKSCVTGNAAAEVLGFIIIPFARMLNLQIAREQPQSSLMWRWPGSFDAFQAHGSLPSICFWPLTCQTMLLRWLAVR